jgi:hypothetical protein
MAPKSLCGAEIRHVGYDPGEPWPAAKAVGWAIAKGPQGKPVGTIKHTGR